MQSNKVYWAVPVVGLVATLALAGCTLGPSAPAPASNSATVTTNTGNVTVSNRDNNFSLSGNSNNTSFSFGQSLPADWPADLPTPSGATIAFAASSKDASSNKITYSATFTLPANGDAAAILNSLKSAYQQAGWAVGNESAANFGIAAGGFSGTKAQQKVDVAFLSLSGSNNAAQNGSTISVSGTYPL